MARIGVIIAKRYVRKAVLRNRIRRLIRESFRHQQSQLFGLDLVVLLRTVVTKPEQIDKVKNNLQKHYQELVNKWENG